MTIEFTTGKKNLLTDITGLRVGNADDLSLKSGVTVITADQPFATAVDVMGGAPGTRETDLLASDKLVTNVDALVFSGGSALGLDAASGVADALRAHGKGFDVAGQIVPIVPGAIIFDLLNGGDKNWVTNPYGELGRQALSAAAEDFDLGSAGAGFGAMTATVKGGLGSASVVLSAPGNTHSITVAALVVANPIGSATVPGTANFWAAACERDKEFGGLGMAAATDSDPLSIPPAKPIPDSAANNENTANDQGQGQNTTLVVVATDADLDVSQLKRMAVAAQDGLARAICPSHTPMDGDIVFALSTTHGQKALSGSEGEPTNNQADSSLPAAQLQLQIGHAASVCVSRAIARAVFEAKPLAGDMVPAWREKYGSYISDS